MGALTQRQEAVTSSNDEVKKRILHNNSLCFIAYFQRKKEQLKLSSHSSTAKSRLRKGVLKHLVGKTTEEIKSISEENEVDNELSANDVPSELSRKVDSVIKNKRRSFGLGVTYLFPLAKVYAKSKDVDALKSEIEALNKSLQKQEEEKLKMRQELDEIKEQIQTLMQH